MIKRGVIARCSRGDLGLVTSDNRETVTYPDGNSAVAYVGLHLSPDMVGKPWSSRNPQIVQNVSDRTYKILLALLKRSPAQRALPLNPER